MSSGEDLGSDNQTKKENDIIDAEYRNKIHNFGITDKDIEDDRKRFKDEENEKQLERNAKKKFDTIRPTKILGFNSARVDLLYKDDKGKTIAYQQWIKRKPNREFIKLSPKVKRNPDKHTLASVGKYPESKQIYKYHNNDDYVYISKGIDFIQLDMDEFCDMVLQVMGSVVTTPNLMEKMINSDFRLQFMSKSKLPHLKLKDWSKERSFIRVSPEDLDKQFEDTLKQNKEERDKLR